jgi:hypothetical protein
MAAVAPPSSQPNDASELTALGAGRNLLRAVFFFFHHARPHVHRFSLHRNGGKTGGGSGHRALSSNTFPASCRAISVISRCAYCADFE